MPSVQLEWVDWALLVVYFAFVVGVGTALKRHTRTGADFLLSTRSMPAWIAGIAFLSANLGAQEVIGMAASGAKYGLATAHFYWLGAIPAMVFVGIFMMPFYYGSRARSVPEYLRLRFDEKTRSFNAITFAMMTIASSGVSLYAMGILLRTLLGWSFDGSMALAAGIVTVYVVLGGLTSAIYNEVVQFFLLIAGIAPLVWLGLDEVGGPAGLSDGLAGVAGTAGFGPGAYTHVWQPLTAASENPMGVEWFGMVAGLGFVLSFGYWCTDFLVVQRALSAESMSAARRAPILAAFPKMLFPALVILPGMVALALAHHHGTEAFAFPLKEDGSTDFDMAVPLLLVRYYPPGMLGLGLTALMASFMSGMAGNVTAFNTVWTYDIYQAWVRKGASDAHYLWVGRGATIIGVAASVAAAYATAHFNNIMDVLQLVFAFVNAPLFGTFLLGMFWRRATGHGAFAGLLAGTLAAALHHGISLPVGAAAGLKGGWWAVARTFPSEMAQNFSTAIWAWTTCVVVTIVVSVATRPRPAEELAGLVYEPGRRAGDGSRATTEPLAWHRDPVRLGLVALGAALLLNLVFA